jgi:gallate dioxygenase
VRRGALADSVRKVHQSYYLPSMTAIATVVYENQAEPPSQRQLSEARSRIGLQMQGVEALEGTYPFDLERSVEHYRINRFLHDLIRPEHRARLLADPEGAFSEAELSETERDLIRRRDWRGLMHYGAIFFVLEKLAAVSGVSNPEVYAAMRGQSLEAFQKTRNAAVTYSVAAQSAPTRSETGRSSSDET